MFGLGGKKSETTLGQAMMGREQGLLDPAPRTRDDPIPQPGGSPPSSSSPSRHPLASDWRGVGVHLGFGSFSLLGEEP
jgi:hypothetical protein